MIQNNTPRFLGHLSWCVRAMMSLREHSQWVTQGCLSGILSFGSLDTVCEGLWPSHPQLEYPQTWPEVMRLGRRWKAPSLQSKVHLGWALWEFSVTTAHWWLSPSWTPCCPGKTKSRESLETMVALLQCRVAEQLPSPWPASLLSSWGVLSAGERLLPLALCLAPQHPVPSL